MVRLGKKAADRKLDGRTCHEYRALADEYRRLSDLAISAREHRPQAGRPGRANRCPAREAGTMQHTLKEVE
jgi:hypothetical protein